MRTPKWFRFFSALFFIAYAVQAASISGVWANDGGDKVTQDELRVANKTQNKTGLVLNKVWDGKTIHLFAAQNEVVSFNLTLEAAKTAASNVSVVFNVLTGPNNAKIRTTSTNPTQYLNRPIELFYEKYLQITGLSFFGYNSYMFHEPTMPERFQAASHQWTDRPDHDKFYPDPLVPLETVKTFAIAQGQNQSIWCDIFVAKTLPAGLYAGSVRVYEGATLSKQIPVRLTVLPFALPDQPTVKTMVALDPTDIFHRYALNGYDNFLSTAGKHAQLVTDNVFKLFHRHKVSPVGENECVANSQPCFQSVPRLNGSMYTAANNYDGPGIGTPMDIFSIGTYGTWQGGSWPQNQANMSAGLTSYGNWFAQNLPTADVILYLQDEPPSSAFPQLETWSNWMSQMTGNALLVKSLSTTAPSHAQTDMPHLQIPVESAGVGYCASSGPCNNTATTQSLHQFYKSNGRQHWLYNDHRPAAGSAMIEDDGIAMRTFGWAQWKLGIDRWFYWYANGGASYTNATTWGHRTRFDAQYGMWGDDAPSNGNGVLIYPGTDLTGGSGISYGLDIPVASIRLKEWRRGNQDADYLALANAINPTATQVIVNTVIPKAEWEYSVPDPTWPNVAPSYSPDPDQWEGARWKLAQIISANQPHSKAKTRRNR